MSEYIYLDHAATTPVHPEVLQAMLPYYLESYGNPSSTHRLGQAARQAVDGARHRIARLLACDASELIFTSGGTESNNLAITGILQALEGGLQTGRHIITSKVEHHAVLNVCRQLETRGYEVTYLPVDETGRVDTDLCRNVIRSDTALISIMYGNNEVGTVQPIREIGELARSAGIPFHVDAAQALATSDVQLRELPLDLMSFSAHKIGGPKGCGALYARSGLKLHALFAGGSQERKRRAGTENVAAIVGFAEGLSVVSAKRQETNSQLDRLRSTLLAGLEQAIGRGAFVVNGSMVHGMKHILNLSFPGIRTETMLMNLDLEGVAVSGGSACSAGSIEPSHVLRAMHVSEQRLQSAVRFSFGFDNNEQQMLKVVKKIETIYQRLRIS